MTIKHIVVAGIIALLTAALMFAAGMHHAVTHMEIEPDTRGETAYVILHDNVYVHDLCAPTAETP